MSANEVLNVIECIPSIYDDDQLFQRKVFLGKEEYEPLSITFRDLRRLCDEVKALTPAAEPFRTGPSEETAWLIEAPGTNYLAARKRGGYEFYWTKDHMTALRFYSREQADLTMMAIRQMNPALFSFAVHLGDASPVEHAWISEGRDTTKPGEA